METQKLVLFVKKNLEIKMLEYIAKLGTVVIMQENIEVLNIAYVINSIFYLKRFL